VDGAKATHYQVTVDVASALETFVNAVRGPERKRMAATLPTVQAKLKAAGLQELPFDVWVDGAGFLKRMRASFDLSKLEPQGPPPSISMTITLSDVGAPVAVQPPPADQVTDITHLMPATSTTST